MAKAQTGEPMTRRPLRLWPGAVIIGLQWLGWSVIPTVAPHAALAGVVGGVFGGGLAIVVWWAFLSRAHWAERWGAVVLMIVAIFATTPFLHESIATGGMGFMFYFYGILSLSFCFVVWGVATCRLSDRIRRVTMVATILLACGAWTLLRTNGITGDGTPEFAWRWAATSEERLLAQAGDEVKALPPAPAAAETTPEWPGFRGPDRDGKVRGVRIETDWSQSPPVEMWRRAIGPGVSSFAVQGGLLYTQEQRGEEEIVAGYRVTSGEPVWRHRDPARFWDAHVGAGPRATPAVSSGRVYSLGATGIVNALDGRDGGVIWSRDAAADTGAKIPHWGFTGSPLVVEDMLIVAAAGRLVAYDLATGELRWLGPDGGGGHSSPQLLTLDGVPQILLMSAAGATSVAPADGTLLWEYAAPGQPILQPALTADGDILISDVETVAVGMRRVAVAQGEGGWTIEERWVSTRFKPYFNDFVVHDGHAFGFDGSILACVDVENGERSWKDGRYGHGQLVLLADQDLLLVVSEQGELALVAAAGDRFTELGRFPAIEGKTWNHPVVVGDVLLVRNREEMAAFRLPVL